MGDNAHSGNRRGNRKRNAEKLKSAVGRSSAQSEMLEPRVFLSSAIAAFATHVTYGVGPNPFRAVTADVNGDGKVDILVANRTVNQQTGTISVLLGNGNGSFVDQRTFGVGGQPMSLTTADVNRDGKLDVIVGNNTGQSVSVLLGNGDGNFSPQLTFQTDTSPISEGIADFNGDGKPDLAVANYNSGTVSILLGNGNGTFGPQVTFGAAAGTRSLAIADMNRDGKADLVVANQNAGTVGILLGNGNGTFVQQATFLAPNNPTAVTVADVDGNGKPDVITGTSLGGGPGIGVLLGNGDGTLGFQNSLIGAPGIEFTVTAADINGDGRLDLVVPSFGNAGGVLVLLGNGNGTFQSAATFATGSEAASASVADLNGDGRPDLVTANYAGTIAGTVSVLLGDVPPMALSFNRTMPAGPVVSNTTTSLTYTLTFNKPVTGVDATDFSVVGSGGGTFIPVIGGSGAVYTVTVNGISANPTLQATLLDNGSIKDFSNNPLQPGGTVQFQARTTLAVGSGQYAALIGDVNGDGKPDLITPNYFTNNISVLLGNANGTFQAQKTFAAPGGPIAGALADFNRDGKTDVLVTQRGGSAAGLLLGNGDGTFGAMQTIGVGLAPFSVVVADVNLDGKADFVTANLNSGSLSICLGNGNGTFAAQQTIAIPQATRVATGDLNGDGRPDLVVTSTNAQTINVLLGNGNGTFQPRLTFAGGQYAYAPAVADVNGDGKADIIAADLVMGGFVSVLLGNGNGTFATAKTFSTGGTFPAIATTADVNGDGKVDIVVPNRSFSSSVGILLGNGDGTFAAPQTFFAFSYSMAATVGDLNGDGKPDIVTTSNQNSISVFMGNGNGSLASQIYYFAPIQKTITGTANSDQFSLIQDADHAHIDWIFGTASGQILINDAAGLTINGVGSTDTINLDYTNGNPLPNFLHVSGNLRFNGLSTSDPLVGTALDIGQSTITIIYPPGSSPASFISQYLKNGYNNGAWNGTATPSTGVITSAAAAAGPPGAFGVGWADAADKVVTLPTFTIMLRYTRMGDVNLDRVVNSTDAIIMARNYITTANPKWDQGNFNFDNTVNLADATILQKNFNQVATGSFTPGVTTPTDPGADSSTTTDNLKKDKRHGKKLR